MAIESKMTIEDYMKKASGRYKVVRQDLKPQKETQAASSNFNGILSTFKKPSRQTDLKTTKGLSVADYRSHPAALSCNSQSKQLSADAQTNLTPSQGMTAYKEASEYAATRGIIIADTKFEFGLDDAGQLVLMDEILTADSSRFWPAETYYVGANPPSYDKQFVRDWLETAMVDGKLWPKTAPAPALPADVIDKTAEKYREALARLTKA